MREIDKIISKERISVFSVPKGTSNEEVLKLIYKDFSKKINFIKEIYPYSNNSLFMYDIMYKHFSIKSVPILGPGDEIKYYGDTHEESVKAFEDGIFDVDRKFFGSGEWPIVLFDRLTLERKNREWISYIITR